ncbi:MAG: PilZ domain-containing protein [Rhizobiaceae bacterium]
MKNSSESEFGLSEFEADLIPKDRRSEPRRITLLQAEIRISEDAAPIACVVNDVSKSGARVFFDVIPTLPRHVHLHIHHPESSHKCEVRWTDGDEVGLMFVD